MTVIHVPFHGSDRLDDASAPLPPGTPSVLVDPVLPDGDRWARLVALHAATAEATRAMLDAGDRPAVVVSGDCLVALGTLTGAQQAGLDPGIVWFDAHGDVHTLASSHSGYLGGMVLRMAVGGDPEHLTGPLGLRPLPEERAVLVDARDLDGPEVDYLATSGIRTIDVTEVTADRLDELLPDGPFVLHVDLDVVDSGELTGLLFPAPDGPSSSAVVEAMRRALATGRVAVLDLACPWHPATGDAEATARAQLISDVLALVTTA